MKTETVVLVEPGKVEIVQEEVQPCNENEILIETKANGICKFEAHQFTGKFALRPRAPMGHEAVGVVREVGKNVTQFREGDKVTVLGGRYSQYAKVHEAGSARIPPETEDYEHWIAEPVACALNGALRCRFEPGQSFALVGCGFMGLLVLQALPRQWLNPVIAIDIDDHRLDLARRFGAEVTLNSQQTDVIAEVCKLAPDGLDVVLEASGIPGQINFAGKLLRWGGMLNIFGFHLGEELVDTQLWHMRGIEVQNASPMSHRNFPDHFRKAVSLMCKGTFNLRELVTHKFHYTEIAKGLQTASHPPKDYMKGVIMFY